MHVAELVVHTEKEAVVVASWDMRQVKTMIVRLNVR